MLEWRQAAAAGDKDLCAPGSVGAAIESRSVFLRPGEASVPAQRLTIPGSMSSSTTMMYLNY
jgi:hypothetical protein